jgi:hypothetical protein
VLCVPPRRLLGIDEIAVQLDLEGASARGRDRDFFQIVLEFLENPLRQTDGSRCVPSFGAVLDAYSHRPAESIQSATTSTTSSQASAVELPDAFITVNE